MRLKLPSSEQWLYMANILLSKLAFKPKYTEGIKRILVVKLDEIGDMATATNVFALLKQSHPQAELHVLCKPFVKNLIENDSAIDRILTDIEEWNSRYDVVVELRGSFSTLFRSLRLRPKYRCSRALVRWKNRGRQLHEIDTNFETIKGLLAPGTKNTDAKLYFSADDKAFVESYIKRENLQSIAIVHAGARRKLRQWNPDRFALAADYLKRVHGKDIVFIGSEDEKKDIEHIRSLCKEKTIDASGVFTLSQLSSLLSVSDFYIGNESGPLHMAAAFSLPSIALFGPGVPNVFYPHNSNAFVFHHVLSCNPCDQIHCVQPDNPCISLIHTADVLLKMDEILQK